MKSLIVFMRIIIVGLLWGIVFTEGMRVIMLCNWHFDIFWPDHWRQVIELWKAGWVVRAPKEWAFVILLITFIPMLLTGWWTLCLVKWEKILYEILISPITLYRKFIKTPINVITTNNKYGVVKKKSYKQVRPTGLSGGIRSPISDYGDNRSDYTSSSSPYKPAVTSSLTPSPAPAAPAGKKTDVAATIDHALFKFDDDDDDFDLDIDSFEKTDFKQKPTKETRQSDKNQNRRKKYDFDDDDTDDQDSGERQSKRERNRNDNRNKEKNNRQRSERDDGERTNQRGDRETSSQGPVFDILNQKNYDIIQNISLNKVTIDYIAVCNDNIVLCLVDKETGDWLADEELFNGEEPLWFSESSHRVSPVRRLSYARNALKEIMSEQELDLNISAYVIIQMANIINADDMFEIWKNLSVEVTRINRGAPKDIPLFSKTLPAAENKMSRKTFEKIQNLLKTK